MPALPGITDYHEAVQSPQISFTDPLLRTCKIVCDPLGLPRVWSGGFALTYQLIQELAGRKWAVRCFKSFIADRQERYAAISRYLERNPMDFFVPISYYASGIRVNNGLYPITRMPWVEGVTLSRYLATRSTNGATMAALANEFKRVVGELDRLGIAHGDLSHLNIIVRGNGKLVLVDYDGMFVPELAGRLSIESGNPNFQHPGRNDNQFNRDLDHFSAIVIYLSLLAISRNPQLYDPNGSIDQKLLFSKLDFAQPDRAITFKRVSAVPGLKPSIERLSALCRGSVLTIPALSVFLSDQQLPLPLAGITRSFEAVASAKDSIFAATDVKVLRSNVGNVTTVVGRVIETRVGSTNSDVAEYLFLNFGTDSANRFTLVFWSDGLQLAGLQRKRPHGYKNKWIRITGLLQLYKNNPQIVYDEHATVKRLPAAEAKSLLGLPAGRLRPSTGTSASKPPHQANLPNSGAVRPSSVLAQPVKVTPPHPSTYGITPGFSSPISMPIRPPAASGPASPAVSPRLKANPSSLPISSNLPIPSLPITNQQLPAPTAPVVPNLIPPATVTATSNVPPPPLSAMPLPPLAPTVNQTVHTPITTQPPIGSGANQPVVNSGPIQIASAGSAAKHKAVSNVPTPPIVAFYSPASTAVTRPAVPAVAGPSVKPWRQRPTAGQLFFILLSVTLAWAAFASFTAILQRGSLQTATVTISPPTATQETPTPVQNVIQVIVIPFGADKTATPTATRIRPTNTATAKTTRPSVTTHTVTAVHLRAGPGTIYAITDAIAASTTIDVLERTSDRTWYYVEVTEHSEFGWLSASTIANLGELVSVPIAQTIPPTPFPAVLN